MSHHTIKFTHSPDGEIEYCKGKSIYSDLFMLGAFALTSECKYTNDGAQHKFETDSKGLEVLIMKSGETLQFLQNAIIALGVVMTDTESENVKESLHELNWLVVGLAELSTMVADNLSDMNYALRSLETNKTTEKVESQ
jgi:hypothetical protein